MSIDPMHLPILGDPRPVEPPAAVRVAIALLLAHVALTVAIVVHTAADPTFFAISVLLTLGFAYGARAGRDWARVAAGLSAFLSVVLSIGSIGGVVELVLVAVSAALLLGAVRLLFRADVGAYFEPGDAETI